RTGVISVSSTPRNAKIYLDGNDTEKETPFVFKRIMPDVYEVSIWREGYRSWTGSVEVKSGETALVQPIQLFKEALPELLLKKEVTALTPNGNQFVTYLVQSGGWSEIWLYNVQDESSSILDMQQDSIITEKTQLSWSANGQRFFAFDPDTRYLKVFSIDGSDYEFDKITQQNSQTVFWHPSNDAQLYLAAKDFLYQIDVTSGEIETFETDEAAGVILDASIITFKDNGTNIELRQSSGSEDRLVALLPRSEYTITERDGSYLILTNTKNTLFLINIHETQPILLETKALHFDWLSDSDTLVYTDGMEVNIYDPSNHQTTFITRQGETIKNILWHPEGINLILVTDRSVSTIERYRVGKQRTSTPLLNDADIRSFWLNATGQTAYFFGTFGEDTGVFSLELTR
ncbi:PEGA domain-containing protein, partial [Patescibacteria group bacterium]|nr:PEGA domain-containing protein [Patescibacteria group bacterium]